MPVLFLIASLAVILGKLTKAVAEGNMQDEEDALMEASELLKAELDRRKFGGK